MTKKSTSRKQQAQKKKEKIQKVALKLFDRYGFANVSMQDIAEAADCSIGNIYHYFKSKDELIIQSMAHVDTSYPDWEKEYQEDEATAREKLLAFMVDSLLINSQEETVYASFVHAIKYPERGLLAPRTDRTWFRILTKLIEDCKAEGAIRTDLPTDDLLREFLVFHRGLLFQWRVEEGAFDLSKQGRKMAEHLLSGIG